MDMFTRFNRKSIDDRQIDTLIGLSKGFIADGEVNQAEAEVLLTWLAQSRQSSENPIILNLLQKVSAMLEDGVLDDDESQELLDTLQQIAGDPVEIGELAKPSTIPLCAPAPQIQFEGRSFVFTGTCIFGTRKECQDATIALGGTTSKGVTKSVDYVVIGSYVTDSWIHETFGRKIEKAMEYRESGVPLAIVAEEHWANCGGLK